MSKKGLLRGLEELILRRLPEVGGGFGVSGGIWGGSRSARFYVAASAAGDFVRRAGGGALRGEPLHGDGAVRQVAARPVAAVRPAGEGGAQPRHVQPGAGRARSGGVRSGLHALHVRLWRRGAARAAHRPAGGRRQESQARLCQGVRPRPAAGRHRPGLRHLHEPEPAGGTEGRRGRGRDQGTRALVAQGLHRHRRRPALPPAHDQNDPRARRPLCHRHQGQPVEALCRGQCRARCGSGQWQGEMPSDRRPGPWPRPPARTRWST